MRTVEEKIRVHDKYQFEIKYNYPLDTDNPKNEYSVETYLFVPNNLGISQSTYGKDDFYRDVQKYIRLKTPVFSLPSIVNGKQCPLIKLHAAIDALSQHPTGRDEIKDCSYHLKMFCSILKSAARDGEAFIEELVAEAGWKDKVADYIKDLKKVADEFRKLRTVIETPNIDSQQLSLYNLADEYISLIIETHLFKLIIFAEKSGCPGVNKCLRLAIDCVKAERAFRTKRHYPSVPSAESNNEEVIYRSRILKKIMGSILFLRTNIKTEGILLQEFFLSIAAGLAMAFATGFIFLSRTTFRDFTVSLFAALILIYIFKDRLKDGCKNFFIKSIQRFLYDYKTVLLANVDVKIGFCRETFSFLKEKSVPQLIKKLRNKDYLGELDNGYAPENIMFCKKYIRIYSGKCKKLFSDFQVDGINDIIRLNIREFLNKMDNPRKFLYVPDGDIGCKRVKADCVYHLILILRYSGNGTETYQKFRIILNRAGIRRIEEIPCELS